MDKQITTFQAKCANCGEVFDHPSLGDTAYGEFIFCSENGKIYTYCNSFDAAARLIEVLLPESHVERLLQSALASLSDPLYGQKFTDKIHCPKCTSINLEYWYGKKTGSMQVKSVTYDELLSLKRNEIKNKVLEFVENYNA